MAPGMGDEVQAIKAGIMEDRRRVRREQGGQGGSRRHRARRRADDCARKRGDDRLGQGPRPHGSQKVALVGSASDDEPAEEWTPPIVRCISTRGEGIADLVASIERHRIWATETARGRARRVERLSQEIREALREALIEEATRSLGDALDLAVHEVETKAVDPYTATERLIAAFKAR